MQDLTALCFSELLVRHGRIASAEVDSLLGELPNAAARADRLIVDFDAGLRGVVGEPFRIDGIWERRAGTSEIGAIGRVLRTGDRGRARDQNSAGGQHAKMSVH